MKKLLFALVAVSTLLLTSCSSCLGTTPTPGEPAPQAEAPDDPQSMVRDLDSLLEAGNGAQLCAKLSNGMEKMSWANDTALVREYGMTLYEYVTNHKDEITALVPNISNPEAKRELPGLVTFFSDIDKLQTFINTLPAFASLETNMAENVADESTTNENE